MILLGISASVGVGLGLFVNLSRVLPTVENIEPKEATIIYSGDGVVLARIFREDRTNVPLKDIPKHLRNATVAVEDKRFYSHSGIDVRGTTRAVWTNIRGGRMTQGGSTITQQLARNVYLSQRKTLQRKLQEAVLAILIERNFKKDKILELYLNQVYYGSGAFGVEAASKVYFARDVNRLSLAQCAMIAGMPQRPSGYSPHEDIEAAKGRRDFVLKEMAAQGYITPQEMEEAQSEPMRVVQRSRGRNSYKAAHFVDYVTKQLRERFGDDVLFSGGLRVYTTLNYKMQEKAEEALRNGVKRYSQSHKVTEGCFVCLEAETGYVRAMVGSVDPASQLNRCTQARRQPGSAFKVFVYTAALNAGWKPNDTVRDAPVSYSGAAGKAWTPQNYDGRWHGTVTLKRAVAQSINIPAIKVAEKVGVQKVIDMARAMGVKADLEPYLSLAIGGIGGLPPIEMASAYCTFANDGIYVEPCSIVRINNSRGEPIADYVPEGRRVVSERVNSMMDEMLRAVVTSRGGTGHRAAAIREARGKTGTTNDDRDAWFIGYVPHKLVAACWVGNDNYAPMRHAYGGVVCAPIWRDFMETSIPVYNEMRRKQDRAAVREYEEARRRSRRRDEPRKEAPRPEARTDVETTDGDVVTMNICAESGAVAGQYCPSTRTETFVRGTEPTIRCGIHTSGQESTQPRETTPKPAPKPLPADVTLVTVTVCPESGLLPTTACPRTVRRRIPADDVPTQTCGLHTRSGGR